MAIFSMPPEFDLAYYKQSYPELNFFPDKLLIEHYKRFAIEQGHSTCIYDRREHLQRLLQNSINKHHIKTLEISPWDNPFLRGDSVKYFDAADVDTLRKSLQENASEAGRYANNLPEKIDFVSPNGDLSVVDETFDLVLSSHVIEHTPDLIRHFQSVEKLLNKGGLYVLLVPDKRYCFDYYHPESTISEVIDAYHSERKIPRLADVINMAFTSTHNGPVLHWLGEHGKRWGYDDKTISSDASVEIMGEFFLGKDKEFSREKLLHLIEKYDESVEKDQYISTHNWRFTPENFGYIVRVLSELKFIDLSLYRLCHTIWGRVEFVAMLEKN